VEANVDEQKRELAEESIIGESVRKQRRIAYRQRA
jgi:hypothetical protein